MIDFSVCIETAFGETERSFPDRVRAAADAGFRAVEIWDWWDKPLPELRSALTETGTELHTLCVESWRDKCQLGDRQSHALFLERLSRAAEVADELGTPKLVVLAGDCIADLELSVQYDSVLDVLAAASDRLAGSNLQIVLEIVNREFEGPNALLQDSATTLQLLRRLNRPNVKYLYDRYHAILNGESLGWAIAGDMDLVGHIQAADVPGRHEFGTGEQDWVSELAWLLSAGYQGFVGIEAVPKSDSSRLHLEARSILEAARATVAKQDSWIMTQ
jgi:hydroxypyruvate isomerase